MKLNKLKYIIPVALLGFVLWSCDESDNTGDSGLTPNNPSVDITALSNSFTIDEQDTTFVITATLSEAAIVDISLDVNTSGTATEDEDYELSAHQMIIPRGSLTTSMEVIIHADEVTAEEDETLIVSIGDDTNANARITTTEFSFTLNNALDFAVNDYVEISLSWDNGELAPDGSSSYCDVVDFDIYILPDGSGSTADDVTGGMATGSCPESSDLDLADGTYNIYKSLWKSTTSTAGTVDWGELSFDVPITVTITRYNNDGTIDGQTSWTEGADETITTAAANHNLFFGVGNLIVSDGNYSFESPAGDTTGEVKIDNSVNYHVE
ncbi:MAG: hypothetical protein ABJH98_13855 [Reichenbachiella sp.]|uniref:hypothetical protein n=1 Tax=Reichenbachiella sp. TaxID=2184521 RepID=UPI00329962E2